jgi:hypothetical protein
LHHHGLRAVHLDRARERRLAGTLEGFVAFSSPIVEGMRKRRSPLAFSASAMRAFINPAAEAGICRHPPARSASISASFRLSPNHPHAHIPRAREPIFLRPRLNVCTGRRLRAIAEKQFDTLLRLLGPPSERRGSDLKRATDIVLVEEGKLIYWPRTGEQFADAAYAMARVQATLA